MRSAPCLTLLIIFPAVLTAQLPNPPVVVIQPTTHVRLGSAIAVTIDWCGYSPTWYDPETRLIKLNGQSVTQLFTTVPVLDAACKLPGEPADEIYEFTTLCVQTPTAVARLWERADATPETNISGRQGRQPVLKDTRRKIRDTS